MEGIRRPAVGLHLTNVFIQFEYIFPTLVNRVHVLAFRELHTDSKTAAFPLHLPVQAYVSERG